MILQGSLCSMRPCYTNFWPKASETGGVPQYLGINIFLKSDFQVLGEAIPCYLGQ